MNNKIISKLGFALCLIGAMYLMETDILFSLNPFAISIKILSVGLMIWSRISFGRRSFHAAADTTEGGLVTNGPYRWLRHPIYTAAIIFFGSCLISDHHIEVLLCLLLIVLGFLVRINLEEKFLAETYGQEFVEYRSRTQKIIPFIY